jgi:hypothetical protein
VLDALVSAVGVVRSGILISLATRVPYRILPWSGVAVSGAGPQRSYGKDPMRARCVPQLATWHAALS